MTGWKHLVACRSYPPDAFFPTRNRAGRPRRVKAAQAICRSCPVLANCADNALAAGVLHGVWAGIDFGENPRLPTADKKAALLLAAEAVDR